MAEKFPHRGGLRIALSLIGLATLSFVLRTHAPPPGYFSPGSGGVQPCPFPARPYDWDSVYMSSWPRNWFNDPDPWGGAGKTDELQYIMSYYEMRYNLSGMLHMYKKTGDTKFLDEYARQAPVAFTPQYFRDGTNGCGDGFLGWGMNRPSVLSPYTRFPDYLGEPMKADTWYDVRVSVRDTVIAGAKKTRIAVLFDNRPFTYTYDAGVYPAGTIALLSGWSSTRFRHVAVRDLRTGTSVYRLDSSRATFGGDWSRVRNADTARYPEDTGRWSVDTKTGDIVCDATKDTPGPFYYPYDPAAPENHGRPPNGTGGGKYAALVLTKAGATALSDYEVSFGMLVHHRNHSLAESGVAVRWHADPGKSLFEGERTRISSRNPYFRHFAKFMTLRFRPDLVEAMVFDDPDVHWTLGALHWEGIPDTYGPRQRFNAGIKKYTERAEYDTRICWTLLDFVETVYRERLEHYYPAADDLLAKIQDNIIAKYYSREFLDGRPGELLRGGSHTVEYGGWKRSSLGIQITNLSYGRLYLLLHRISRDAPERWRRITDAAPRNVLPPADSLAVYYKRMATEIGRAFIAGKWNVGDHYEWPWLRDFYGEYDGGSPDLLHQAETILFLVDSHAEGILTAPELDSLGRTFTEKIWNGKSGGDAAIASSVDGSVGGPVYGSSTWNWDYWISLSAVDFRVWETLNDWTTKYHCAMEEEFRKFPHDYFYHIQQALLVYYVKYGVPRDFSISAAGEGGRNVTFAWKNPSDYPAGPGRPDGTGLRFFNIYRRAAGTPWPATPVAQLPVSAHTYTDSPPDSSTTYEYIVRSQDWTKRFKNESDDSKIVKIRNGKIVP
jgi:hypothetical protein